MEIVRPSTSPDEATLVRIVELTHSHRLAGSSFVDEAGNEISIMDLIIGIEKNCFGAQHVGINPNGYRTEMAKDHATALARGKLSPGEPEEPIYAIISHRPPTATLTDLAG